MRRIFLLLAAQYLFMAASAQTAQSRIPALFQEGVISKGDYESHPAFSPTGDTLYFIKCSTDLQVSAICVSYRIKNKWTEPQITSFSGKYMDADPFVTGDGKSLYFMSNRPVKDGDPVRDNTDIWKVTLTAAGWSRPVHLQAPVNSDADEYYPTIDNNGDIYFGSTRKGGLGGSDIYCCRLKNGQYQPAVNLGEAINSAGNEYEAFIAPNESYLIYNATPKSLGGLDFYISYNLNGTWTKAKKLPQPVSSDGIDWSPKVTRDGKLFYFSSTRNRWMVTPLKAENIGQFNHRLQSAGNGLADIYTLPFNVISQLINRQQ